MKPHVPEINAPILVKIKHHQRTPQWSIEHGKPHTQKRAHDGDNDNTVTASIDGEIQYNERNKKHGDVIMIQKAISTHAPTDHPP